MTVHDAAGHAHVQLARGDETHRAEEEQAADQIEADRRDVVHTLAVQELARQRAGLEQQQFGRAQELAVEVPKLVKRLVLQLAHGGARLRRALPALRAPSSRELVATVQTRRRFHRTLHHSGQ